MQYARGGNIITNNSFSNRDAFREVHNLRIGMDFQVDTATVIGALVSGYNNRWKMTARNGAIVNRNFFPDTVIHSVDDPELNLWQNLMVNLNFQHVFRPGSVLFVDANYIYYRDNNPNTYSTDYYNSSKELLYHEDQRSGKVTPIHFQVFSSDYTTPLGKRAMMEAGAKISFSTFTNDVRTEKLIQGTWVEDAGLSAHYLLKEDIAAAYSSFSLNLDGKMTLTAGLRYEYTRSNLGESRAANIVDRRYGQLFPTLSVSKKFDGDSRLNFSYGRRITRPAFNDLAPFTIFFDPKTFFSGNPALQPAIAHAIQASYSYRNYSVTISYTHELNTIDNFYFQTQRIDSVSNVLYLSSRNFKVFQYLAAGFSLPLTLTQWWSMQNNINGNFRWVRTSFDTAPVLLEKADISFSSTQRITLPAAISLELTGMYATASYIGTAIRRPYYQLDAGVQKRVGRQQDIIQLTANDVFNSGGNYQMRETLPVTGAIVNRDFNFRLAAYKLTYTHRFGNHALKGRRERGTGAEDELRRVNN